MSHRPIEQSELYRQARELATEVWFSVKDWEGFAKWTVGRQLVSCLDSVAANLAEGDGRFSDRDAVHFFVIARGSIREAGYWIDVAVDRRLIPFESSAGLQERVQSVGRQLNGLIGYRRSTSNKNLIREETVAYDFERSAQIDAQRPTLDAPFTEDLQLHEG